MYEVVNNTPWQVFIIYFVFLSVSIVTYPILSLIYKAIGEGLERWK